ncbi:MAG: hypothetical protein QGI57_02365 [Dehalococcoidales bacterium]|jgi:hypothetical protein|nr:hypothetical protein [Dehalococcoidales bacterium]|tara:strand:- start:6 stop:188 length:183 start_codon:yes stop_codon:yes gene_type:complete
MGIMALIVGIAGGLCAVVGISIAVEIMPTLMPKLTWEFWFMLSAILYLTAITLTLSRGYE